MESFRMYTGRTMDNTKEPNDSDVMAMDCETPAPQRNLNAPLTAAFAPNTSLTQLWQSST